MEGHDVKRGITKCDVGGRKVGEGIVRITSGMRGRNDGTLSHIPSKTAQRASAAGNGVVEANTMKNKYVGVVSATHRERGKAPTVDVAGFMIQNSLEDSV